MSDVPTLKISDGDGQQEKEPNLLGAWRQRRESNVSHSTSGVGPIGHPGAGMRRRSTMKGIAQTLTGLIGLRRMTLAKKSDVSEKPKIRMENTYKMIPDDKTTFSQYRVSQVVQEILEADIGSKRYNETECSKLACDLSIKVKNKVKELNFPRYKIVCNVIIGEVSNQGLEAASRCIWDPKADNYACITYKNSSVFAVVLVHGVYFE